MRKKVAALFGLCLFLVCLSLPALAAIKVVSEPGADTAMVEDVQKTIDVFNSILKVDMGTELTRDVSVIICPTRESYAGVLRRELGQSQEMAERNAAVTGGMSGGSRLVVAINGGAAKVETGLGRAQLTAHELFHQTQSQLSKDKKGKGLYWMSEGTADLIGAWVAEKRGFQSMEKWKLDRLNVIRKAGAHVAPAEILHTDLPKWTRLMEKKLYPYEMSDLMVFYLTNQYATINPFNKIADYYRLIGQGVDGDQALLQAFGVGVGEYVGGFRAWLARSMAEEVKVELIAEPGVTESVIAEMERTLAVSRRYFQETWQSDFSLGLRVVVAPEKSGLVAAVAREFGFSPTEAANKVKTSTWYYSGGTAVIQASLQTARSQRVFSLASLLMRKQLEQNNVLADLSSVSWLRYGLEDVVAAYIVELEGSRSVASYRDEWSRQLTNKPKPSREQMADSRGWNEAGEKFGTLIRRRAAALAVFQLIDEYGLDSTREWLSKTKELGNGAKAFELVYKFPGH